MISSQERTRASKLMQPKTFASKLAPKDESNMSSNVNIILSSNESIAAKNNQAKHISRLKQPSVPVQDKNKANQLGQHNTHMTQTKSCNSFGSVTNSTNDLFAEEVHVAKNSKSQKPSRLPATPGMRSSSAIAKLTLKPDKFIENSFANSENNLNQSPQRRFKSSERSLNLIGNSSDKISALLDVNLNSDAGNKISTSIDINLNSQLPISKKVGVSKLIKPKTELSKCPMELSNSVSETQSLGKKLKSPISSSLSEHTIRDINFNSPSKLSVTNKKPESKLPALNCRIPKVPKTTPTHNIPNLTSTYSISLSPSSISKNEDISKLGKPTFVDSGSVLNTNNRIKTEVLEASNIMPMQPMGLQSPFLRMAKETLSNSNQNKLFISSTTNKSEMTGSSDSLEDILSAVGGSEDADMFDATHNRTTIRKLETTKSDAVNANENKRACEGGYSSDGDILCSSDKRISSGYISDGASSINEWMRARSQNLINADKCSLSNSDDASSIVSDQLNCQSINNNAIKSSNFAAQFPKVNIKLNVPENALDIDSSFNRSIKVRSTLPTRGKKAILPLDGFAQKSSQDFKNEKEEIFREEFVDKRKFIKSPSADTDFFAVRRTQTPDFDRTPTQKSLEDSFNALNKFDRKGSLGADSSVKKISLNLSTTNKPIDSTQTKEMIDAYISKYSKIKNENKFAMPNHIQEFNSYTPGILMQQSPLHHPSSTHHHFLPNSPYNSLGRSAKLNVMRPPTYFTCPHDVHQIPPPKMSIKEDEAWNELNANELMRRRATDVSQFLDVRMSPMHRRDSNSVFSSVHQSTCVCDNKDVGVVNPKAANKQSIMGESLNGSSLSLGSCSSLFSNVEDFNVHEIRRLRRELELAQTRVSSLNMQLNINENVVQAFEQSVSSLNARLQCLTFLAGDKANHIGELQAAMNHIKSSKSFCSHHRHSLHTDNDLISEGQDIEKKKRQKKWLTSIGKAFNRKRSKQQNEVMADGSSVVENDIKNENELIRQLEIQLQEREMKLTDAQLDALSSAHQLDLLRNAMSQMQKEMMNLKKKKVPTATLR